MMPFYIVSDILKVREYLPTLEDAQSKMKFWIT